MKRTKMKYQILMLIYILTTHTSARSQTLADLDRIDSIQQYCLDNNPDMYSCSNRYYVIMDSMLNAVYKQLIKKYPERKGEVKKEELAWLQKRDKKFTWYDTHPEVKDMDAYSNLAIAMDRKAQYVEERVRKLIGELNK